MNIFFNGIMEELKILYAEQKPAVSFREWVTQRFSTNAYLKKQALDYLEYEDTLNKSMEAQNEGR